MAEEQGKMLFEINTTPAPGKVAFVMTIVGNVNTDNADELRADITSYLEMLQAITYDPQPGDPAPHLKKTGLDLIGIQFLTKPGFGTKKLETGDETGFDVDVSTTLPKRNPDA